MARKRYKPEEIVGLLRQAEVLYSQGMSMADAVRQLGISEVTRYRWRDEWRPAPPSQGAWEGERMAAPGGFRSDAGQADPCGGGPEKLLGPSRRRHCIDHVRGRLGISERRACRVLGQHRSTQRRIPCGRDNEDRLVADMIELARRYGRYGYRRIAALLRAARADHVWSCDFVHHRTHDGRAFRTLNVLDELTRESLAIRVRRKLSSVDVIDVLTDLRRNKSAGFWRLAALSGC